jgi:hypothetical protein
MSGPGRPLRPRRARPRIRPRRRTGRGQATKIAGRDRLTLVLVLVRTVDMIDRGPRAARRPANRRRSRPGCWRHTASVGRIADVAELHAASSGDGPAVMWSASNQLQTNVVTLPPHGHIGTHGETVLDVTLTVLFGSLILRHGTDDDDTIAALVTAPAVVVLPAGTRRSLRAGPAGATYLTAHRARAGLLPTVR